MGGEKYKFEKTFNCNIFVYSIIFDDFIDFSA